MTRLISEELPNDLYRRLSGSDLEMHAGKVILISTVDVNGWSHPAMLSYFEVVAKDRRSIRLATYKDSAQELKREMRCLPHSSKLNLRVEQVLTDQADEELESGVYVSGGITYSRPDPAAELLKAKDVLRELLE
jgi:hypothetical protein